MLRNTEKMKSSNKNVFVHERFINLKNPTLERKSHENKMENL